MQTHLTLRKLKGAHKTYKDVQLLFATQPNRKAILFIHGFSGDAIRTWSDFHELLQGRPQCACHDIIFYGYDGLRAELNGSAGIFRDFLSMFFDNTMSLLGNNLPPSARRSDEFVFDELVIVAHSLGAVIARRALIDATRNGSDWVARTKLVLYAPAHKGANVADLALEVASSFIFLKWFAAFARFQSPLIDQLKPGSPSLTQLLTDTEMATMNGSNRHLIARKVIIAQYEHIVYNEPFGNDPIPDTIPEASHTSVCKPKNDFIQPLVLLEACL